MLAITSSKEGGVFAKRYFYSAESFKPRNIYHQPWHATSLVGLAGILLLVPCFIANKRVEVETNLTHEPCNLVTCG